MATFRISTLSEGATHRNQSNTGLASQEEEISTSECILKCKSGRGLVQKRHDESGHHPGARNRGWEGRSEEEAGEMARIYNMNERSEASKTSSAFLALFPPTCHCDHISRNGLKLGEHGGKHKRAGKEAGGAMARHTTPPLSLSRHRHSHGHAHFPR